jgi:hypothetical protein
MEPYLVTETIPKAHRLDDILIILREDLLKRSRTLADSQLPEAKQVMKNNMKILDLLTQALVVAQNSNRLLNRSFGPPAGKRHSDR